MTRYIEDLNENTAPTTGDYLLCYDASAGGTDKDRKVNISKFAILANAGTFTARQKFANGVGLSGSKSVTNNSATALCDIVIGGGSALAAAYLVGVTVQGGANSSAQMWVLEQAFSAATITKLSEALFGHSSIVITVAANTGSRKVTLTITQVNGTATTCTVEISVLPLMVAGDPTITLTML